MCCRARFSPSWLCLATRSGDRTSFVLLLTHIVAAHLLWRLLLHIGVLPAITTALATVFVPARRRLGEPHVGVPNRLRRVGALRSGWCAAREPRRCLGRRDAAGWLVSVVGLMFSGISDHGGRCRSRRPPRRGWRQALLTVSVPGAVYLAWLVLIGHHDVTKGKRGLHDAVQYPAFIWSGLRSLLSTKRARTPDRERPLSPLSTRPPEHP